MAKPINLEIKTDYRAEKIAKDPEVHCSYPELRFGEQFFKLLKPHVGDLNVGDEVTLSEVTLRMKRKSEDITEGGSFCFDVLSFSGVEDASVAEKEEPEMDGTDDE